MDQELNTISVTTESGERFEAEVIDIFGVEGYPDKEYILYSFGEEVDQDHERVYMSILKEGEDGYVLDAITDPQEIKDVQDAVDEFLAMSDEEVEALREGEDGVDESNI